MRGSLPVHPSTGTPPRAERELDWLYPNQKESIMRGVVMHAPGDVRVEELEDAKIIEPTDAVIRLAAACICGSDLWPYRGIDKLDGPAHMGHEYVGVVEQIGDDVKNVKVGDFVVGSFVASDNTCENCQAGYQSGCIHRVFMTGT